MTTPAQVLEALGGEARCIVRDFEGLEAAVAFIGSPARLTDEPDDHERRARERRARKPEPCSRCVRGMWTDCNGARWRCSRCGGTGSEPVRSDDPILED